MTIRKRLFALMGVPLILSLGFAGNIFVTQLDQLAKFDRTHRSHMVVKALSGLLSGMQGERSKAVQYLNFDIGGGELTAQSVETDLVIKNGMEEVYASGILPEDLVKYLKLLPQKLGMLRTAIDTRGLDPKAAIVEYTRLIDGFMRPYEYAVDSSYDTFRREFTSIHLIEASKEYAGQTSALVAMVAAEDEDVELADIVDLLTSYAGIEGYLKGKGLLLSEKLVAMRDELLLQPEWATVRDTVSALAAAGFRDGSMIDDYETADAFAKVVGGIQGILDAYFDSVKISVDAALARARFTVFAVIAAVAFIVAVSVLSSIALIRSITSRLDALSTGLADLERGEGDLTRAIDIHSRDEIGQLAGGFNSFMGTLRELVAGVKREAAAMAEGTIRLSGNMEETAGSVRQIAANIESLKQQTRTQAVSVTESSATIEEIVRNVNALYAHVERQSESLATSSSSIEEMVANIQSVTANVERMGVYYEKLLGKSDEGKSALQGVSTRVREVDERSESLQDTNNLIAGIAAQTNLLAMNAAIEAAHAGEAGQGFAVVADEIRKLAENAARQSKIIAQNVREIRGVIEAVVDSSGTAERTFGDILEQIQVLSRLEEEVKYAMQEQSSGSAQVLDSLVGINADAQKVRESATLMQQGSGVILEEMKNLLRLSTELENGMNEMAAGTSEIQRSATDTASLAVESRESVGRLKSGVDRFKT